MGAMALGVAGGLKPGLESRQISGGYASSKFVGKLGQGSPACSCISDLHGSQKQAAAGAGGQLTYAVDGVEPPGARGCLHLEFVRSKTEVMGLSIRTGPGWNRIRDTAVQQPFQENQFAEQASLSLFGQDGAVSDQSVPECDSLLECGVRRDVIEHRVRDLAEETKEALVESGRRRRNLKPAASVSAHVSDDDVLKRGWRRGRRGRRKFEPGAETGGGLVGEDEDPRCLSNDQSVRQAGVDVVAAEVFPSGEGGGAHRLISPERPGEERCRSPVRPTACPRSVGARSRS